MVRIRDRFVNEAPKHFFPNRPERRNEILIVCLLCCLKQIPLFRAPPQAGLVPSAGHVCRGFVSPFLPSLLLHVCWVASGVISHFWVGDSRCQGLYDRMVLE